MLVAVYSQSIYHHQHNHKRIFTIVLLTLALTLACALDCDLDPDLDLSLDFDYSLHLQLTFLVLLFCHAVTQESILIRDPIYRAIASIERPVAAASKEALPSLVFESSFFLILKIRI